MKVTFKLRYRTQWGQQLYISGNNKHLGAGDESKAILMKLQGDDMWMAEVNIPYTAAGFHYHYFVRHDNGQIINEWGDERRFNPLHRVEQVELLDRWQEMPWDKPFYSSAFTDCIFERVSRTPDAHPASCTLTLRVWAPTVKPDEIVAVSGEGLILGDWDPAKAIKMSDENFPQWSINIPLVSLQNGGQYKFVILKKDSGQLVGWETGDNRVIDFKALSPDAVVVDSGQRMRPIGRQWKGAGTAIPVFALRSDDDCGVGDFMDLIPMIDWAKATGQNFIQLLPINDTTMTGTWTDSYPYNANSTFALHPMYLRLQEMGRLDNDLRRQYYSRLRRELNALPQVDYERVNAAKWDYTCEIFAQEGTATLDSPEFKTFFEKNRHWLEPYAAFCVLRDINHTAEMTKWGDHARYDEAKIKKLQQEHQPEINIIYFVQFHLDRQLTKVREYAHHHGVALKGDIPIGISRTSVDAWVHPELFNMDCQAGAPPDAFSTLGQNWGFPTYNWEEMAKDGFAWWKARLGKMAEYFDAYRIDHVLGFFRIWQIPIDAVHGLLGIFHPALPLAPDEMRYSYDFWLDVNLQTTPYIMDWFLGDFFGEYTDECRDAYLEPLGYGRYKLKEAYSTQRKVVDYFATQEQNDKNKKISEALLGLIDQVLFIEDPYERGKYHPRISAQFTYIYRSLNDYEKFCYDRMYNDFFYRRHNDFWYGKAMWKLPQLINATGMLACAEDLGMIPDCVPTVLRQLEILTLEIQRMPKDPKEPFGNTWNYPYFSVCTTSTHDMDGIRRWWELDPDVTQRYYNEVLKMGGKAPEYAEPWVCEKIVELQLQSPSMLAILPLQDWLATDGMLRRNDPREELINVPANPRHYWRYRMHLTLENLLGQTEFNTRLKQKIHNAQR